MARLFSESEQAALRRQFLSTAFGQEITEDTANALLNAAQALVEAEEANNNAVTALADAQAALTAAGEAATPADVILALTGYATEAYVQAQGYATEAYVDGKFDGTYSDTVNIDGVELTFVNGLLTEVGP